VENKTRIARIFTNWKPVRLKDNSRGKYAIADATLGKRPIKIIPSPIGWEKVAGGRMRATQKTPNNSNYALARIIRRQKAVEK
jgi:hypothetical protein